MRHHGLAAQRSSLAIATLARDTIGRCDYAAVTIVAAGTRTVVSTDAVARDLVVAQYEAGDGPCLDAIRFLQVFNVGVIADEATWPAFRAAAVERGIRSSLSVPLTHPGRAFGALSLYSIGDHGFDGCEGAAMAFAIGQAQNLWAPTPREYAGSPS